MMHDFFSPPSAFCGERMHRKWFWRVCALQPKSNPKHLLSQVWLVIMLSFLNAELIYHSQPSYLSWHFIWGRDWIYNHRGIVCHNCSGRAKHSSLWPWLAVKSPFNRLLPGDIALHPLTLDITTPAWVSWNCSGGVWASLLNCSTIHFETHWKLKEATHHLLSVLCIVVLSYLTHPRSSFVSR